MEKPRKLTSSSKCPVTLKTGLGCNRNHNLRLLSQLSLNRRKSFILKILVLQMSDLHHHFRVMDLTLVLATTLSCTSSWTSWERRHLH